MAYDKPIVIQRIDEGTELWSDIYRLHARVNKSNGSEYLSAVSISLSLREFSR